jgi:signal transduction histidine kinase
MVSGLAHEVNNPNNIIKLTAHLLDKSWRDIVPILEKRYLEEGDFRIAGQKFTLARTIVPEHITGIRNNALRIEGIIKNLRDFARKGVANLHSRADLNTIVSMAATILNSQIKHSCRNFNLVLDETVPTVRGNPQQLEQVVINLILNAIQSLPTRERKVTVSTSFDRDNGFVLIMVDDEGAGMPPDVKERIGEPFFTTKIDRGGTGLGLAISAFIIKEHQGLLEFESEPDNGTTVRVKLPVALEG